MLQFKGTKNLSEKQVQTGCSALHFKVTKNTPVDTPQEFFAQKDGAGNLDDLNLFDRITVRYNGPRGGQKQIISELPIFPLLVACTTGPNHMIFENDPATGKIVGCAFTLQLGVNGALRLDGDHYISVKTNFQDLATIEMYSIDGVPTSLAYQYTNAQLDANVQRTINLNNVNKLILDPMVELLELNGAEGYTVQVEQAEVIDIAEGLNDIIALRGNPMTYNRVNGGDIYPVKMGIEATKQYTGGLFYPTIGVEGYDSVRVQSPKACYVYTTIVTDLGILENAQPTVIAVPVAA